MAQLKTKTAKRTIYFFKVSTESNKCLSVILKKVSQLDGDEMYTPKGEKNEDIYLRKLEENEGFFCGEVSILRSSGLPSKAKRGEKNIFDIGLLDNEGLVESTHFLYAPTNKILVLEYNHFGPRIGTLQWHLNNKICKEEEFNITEIGFEPILNKDTLKILDDSKEIKVVSFTIPKANISNEPEDDFSFSDMVRNSMNYGNTGRVSISLKMDKTKKDPIISPNELKMQLKKIGCDIGDVFDEFKIRSLQKSTNTTKTFDLLQDKIKDEVTIIKLDKKRKIDSSNMFSKMQESYQRLKEDLNNSANYE